MSEALAATLVRYHPESAATILEQQPPEEAAELLRQWPAEISGRVLERMLPHAASEVLATLGAEAWAELLSDMQPRAAVRVLQHFDHQEREALLAGLDEADAASLRALAAWPAETAGGMMDTQVVTLRDHLSVAEVIESIRRAPPSALHYLYVADRANRLVGVLVMRDVLLARPQTPVSEIMRTTLVTLPVATEREDIAEVFAAHGFAVLPVVDEEDRLVGVVRHDAVIEAARDEAYEDLQRMVGAGAGERALDPVGLVIRRRLPWLLVNLATAFAAAFVVGLFESTIATITALAVLLPIVAGQSGNTGAQTLAVIIRGLAMGDVRGGVHALILRKEVLAGLFNSLVVATVCALAVWAWDGRGSLALVIGGSMVLAMVLAAAAGTLIPIVIDRLGRDPAQSSSIFLTTVPDMVGFGVFLGAAALFSNLLVPPV